MKYSLHASLFAVSLMPIAYANAHCCFALRDMPSYYLLPDAPMAIIAMRRQLLSRQMPTVRRAANALVCADGFDATKR